MFLFVEKYDIPSIHRLVPAGESETGCWHCLIPALMSFFYFLSTAASWLSQKCSNLTHRSFKEMSGKIGF